jgi:heme O synthase-like polyprenyltransferase
VLRQYLTLFRLPNVFTAPSNILAGYYAVVEPANASGLHLGILIICSILLYLSGIVLNDYFDIEVDRRERPLRPLPAGTVSKRKVLLIGIVFIIAANFISLLVSTSTFIIAAILSGTIVSYDYRMKYSVYGPGMMGAARALNVMLGSSPIFLTTVLNINNYARIAVVTVSLFVFVFAISRLSRKEIDETDKVRTAKGSFLMIIAVLAIIIVSGLVGVFLKDLFANLALFAIIMIITFKPLLQRQPLSSKDIQRTIKTMVLSIIVLDSAFVSGSAGTAYGLVTVMLIMPAIILSRKFYVT